MKSVGCDHCQPATITEPFARAPLPDELDRFVEQNTAYRRVMFTDMSTVTVGGQQVAMAIGCGADSTNDRVGWEQHKQGPWQYFAVVQGEGVMLIGDTSDEERATRVPIHKGSKWVVPAGKWHDVRGKGLKLFTLYSHRQHPPGQVDLTRADAERREHEE